VAFPALFRSGGKESEMEKYIIQGADAFGNVDCIEITEDIPQEVIDFLEQPEREWQNYE